MHAHEEEDVDLLEVRQDRVERGLGVVDEPDAHAVRPHPVEQRARVTELDVHRARVRTGLGEVVEQITRVVDHQVAVEVQVRARPQARTTGAPIDRFGHEVPVHHVDVEQVGLRPDPVHLRGELREVRREDRRCDLSHGATLAVSVGG